MLIPCVGYFLIWPKQVCAAEQGMVFKVLSLKRGIRFHYYSVSVLNTVSFWTGSLSKIVKTCDERSTFAIPITFSLNIYFHDFGVKNYLILYAKQSKSGSESCVSCLRQGSEMRSFCLKKGRGLRASAAHLDPNFP